MKQPELGKKISELRLAKGLTQGELAQKCNVSLRTIQRIESADVTPRSVTVRLIFSSLDYEIYNFNGHVSDKLEAITSEFKTWPGQFYLNVLDLFNLKTNTMRKITILSVLLFAVIFGLTSVFTESQAQSAEKVREIIDRNNENFKQWFNNQDIDQLMQLYHDDACILAEGCGKEYVKQSFLFKFGMFTFSELKTTSVNVGGDIAVEKGKWEIIMDSGEKLRGEYLTEWHQNGREWLIMNESAQINPGLGGSNLLFE
jgi:ketosteroid isomerase-like protein/DNA-binding XRE family transcriptional regulator